MEIIDCLQGHDRFQYSTAVKQFALALNYYSPRAYNFIRQTFNYNLPHTSTLKQWYRNSDSNGEPGFCKEGLTSLKHVLDDMKRSEGKDFYCSLVFDEVYIRKHVQYVDSRKKFLGYVTYGTDESEALPIATQAIVFLVNGINKIVNMPVAHHFIGSLKAVDKAKLLMEVITEVTKTGAIIVNVSFDGLVMNFKTMGELGASFNLEDFRPSFLNPVDKRVIRIILDPAHMMKLLRNCLEDKQIIYDQQNRQIKWKHLVNLESIAEKNEFLTHKLTKKHINIKGRKMNVKIAAQTLSNHVANSLEYLMRQERKGFKNCSGTIEYCRNISNLFAVFNSMHADTKGNTFKVPLSPDNATIILPFLNESADYIKSLRLKKTSVLTTKRKTGFLGFLINIHNLKEIYIEYVVTSALSNVPTYQLGQDPLESFFSRLRSQRGADDNMTVEQFKSAYRKVIVNRGITSSSLANCRDKLNILSVSSTQKSRNISEASHDHHDHHDQFDPFTTNDYLMDACEDATIANISAHIEQKIRERGQNCDDAFTIRCLNILNENNRLSTPIPNDQPPPSISTTYVCKVAKKYFDIFAKKMEFDYGSLLDTILNKMDYDVVYPDSDFSENLDLKEIFVQFIAEEFIRFQANHLAKTITLEMQSNAIRQKLTKTIHFYGQ